MREVGRLAVVLVLICVVAAGGLAAIRQALSEKIELQSDFYVRGPALQRLLDRPAQELLSNKVKLDLDGAEVPVFFLRADGTVRYLAVEAAGRGGYGGDIEVMIGLDLETDTVLGLEIIAHSETPGVGANVVKAAFRDQWRGLAIAAPIQLGRDVDAVSGASYSSHAVVDGTNRILTFLRDRRAEILAAIDAAPGGGKGDAS